MSPDIYWIFYTPDKDDNIDSYANMFKNSDNFHHHVAIHPASEATKSMSDSAFRVQEYGNWLLNLDEAMRVKPLNFRNHIALKSSMNHDKSCEKRL
jgi:hypothetical protein